MLPPTYLNVAEKPSVAKAVAEILSRGHFRRRPGISQYNAVFEFEAPVRGVQVRMLVTSVSGHLMNCEFPEDFKKWESCPPLALFDAPVVKFVTAESEPIKQTLERESRAATHLVCWLDCDREGENISFEVIQVCRAANPRLQVLRAHFSSITPRDIERAVNALGQPDALASDAVDARQEIDLRIGAAFTRWQTLHLRPKFADMPKLLSYGACQFPTLGFVVDRYWERESFQPETFWSIAVTHVKDEGTPDMQRSEFSWKRFRLFDHHAALVLYELVMEDPTATVLEVQKREKRKWRPLPLSTVELQKLAARHLRLSSEQTMSLAEGLYNEGFLSYPRTETDRFTMTDPELRALVEEQAGHGAWGPYAQRLLQGEYRRPREGRGDDKAHPPIHPTKRADGLAGDRGRVYELVARHFLACCSEDALANEVVATIDIGGEAFTTKGQSVVARNYLEVYPYDKWFDRPLPQYEEGARFAPTSVLLEEGHTTPPPYLQEADLIALMDQQGIGTDATIATHIKTIQDREYVKLQDRFFIPTKLGLALVQGYDVMGYALSTPHLRAEMEKDMKSIALGQKTKAEVLRAQLAVYRDTFVKANAQVHLLDDAVRQYFDAPRGLGPPLQRGLGQCGKCGNAMDLMAAGAAAGPPGRERARLLVCRTPACGGFEAPFGELSAHPHTCPLCRYRVLTVTSTERGTSHTVCPACFRSPPAHLFDIEGAPGAMRCFQCPADCPLAGGVADAAVKPCPQCGQPLQLKRRKNGAGYFVGCQGYRGGCQYTVFLPAGDAKVTTDTCGRCPDAPKLIGFKFQSGQLPPSIPLQYTACLFCDAHLSPYLTVKGSGVGPLPSPAAASALPPPPPPPPPASAGLRQSPAAGAGGLASAMSLSLADLPRVRGGGRGQGRGGGRPAASTVGPAAASDSVRCGCGEAAVTRTVQKEGPNKGRQFYTCPKPPSQRCGLFQWADEAPSAAEPPRPPPPGGRGRGGRRAEAAGGAAAAAAPWAGRGPGGAQSVAMGFVPASGLRPPSSADQMDAAGGTPACLCGHPATRLQSRKENSNKGKWFWTCPERKCNFFQWEDP